MEKWVSQNLTKPVTDVYLSIEDQILKNIAKKIARDNSILIDIEKNGNTQLVESWQLSRLSELDAINKEHIEIISSRSGKTMQEVEKMLSNAGYSAVDEIEGDMFEGAKKGKLLMPPESAKGSESLKNVLVGYQRQAKNTLNLTNTTILDLSRQKYLDVINDTTGKVLAGVSTPQQALRESIKELANKGVPALVDKKGREWSTEAYVSMVMRSTSNNVANDMQDTRMDEYDVDLVEVSSHDGARPLCAPYQGRIFSRSGNHPKYPALGDTSMGHPAGLFGVHCGHVKYPYFEGTKKTYNPVSSEKNDRMYEESQKQRYLEREIRKAKREMVMMIELDDDIGIVEADDRIKERQANLRSFIKRTGRTRTNEREQIR
ncbi:minor capsid protein [Oceanobacillus sp. E9]|uniref:phage minor capsid protein n=1 Tax=Oceanobacillus sp. E9 TaxID=1742575 RepID=UPI00084EA7EF|nr:phage minor capsid protein [Oceanobacillus sp. E9]OEH53130.1 minor capsid protein [Oceanobacillus sp. E9]